jgi:hypothetical protein
MKSVSPYRSLPAARRVALVQSAITLHKEARAKFAQRIVSRGGGFRAAAVLAWPADRLAREVVRLNAESASDELELLQLLYVDLEPAIQCCFLDAAGVSHERGVIAESLEPPYTSADGVAQGVAAVRAAHGDDGERYLRALVRYNAEAWPGIVVAVGAR